jgi:hypothetical protein
MPCKQPKLALWRRHHQALPSAMLLHSMRMMRIPRSLKTPLRNADPVLLSRRELLRPCPRSRLLPRRPEDVPVSSAMEARWALPHAQLPAFGILEPQLRQEVVQALPASRLSSHLGGLLQPSIPPRRRYHRQDPSFRRQRPL